MAKKDYLVIDRAKWRTGDYGNNSTGEGDTALLNNSGFMCCLGFRCQQMGIPRKQLLHVGDPEGINDNILDEDKQWDIPGLLDENGRNTKFCSNAIVINDSQSMTREEREEAITEHFAKEGITVIFKGKYKK